MARLFWVSWKQIVWDVSFKYADQLNLQLHFPTTSSPFFVVGPFQVPPNAPWGITIRRYVGQASLRSRNGSNPVCHIPPSHPPLRLWTSSGSICSLSPLVIYLGLL